MIENRSLHCIFILFTALFLHASLASLSHAEITLDGTVGPCGPLSGPDFMIRAEAGRQVGGNLFHSFSLFNVNAGESATFTGPDSVENILGRVTGGSSSTINGLLRSEIPGADLFLINPAGIMFGANAQLDVQGSFHASTADYVSLGEHGRFDAVEPDKSLLTVARPSAFGFLGDNPAGISIKDADLEVPKGETLSLIGGDIEIIGGKLTASSGRINIASASSKGKVLSHTSDLGMDSFEELGKIDINQGANIDVSGGGGEGVFIRGGVFALSDGSIINSSTISADPGSDISITTTDSVSISGGSIVGSVTSDHGNAGDISISASTLKIESMDENAQRQSSLITSTTGDGNAGDIELKINESIEISGNSRIFTSTFAADSLLLGSPPNKGNAGEILIKSGSLKLRDGATIDSSSFLSEGIGGNISITTKELVTISGHPVMGVSSCISTGSSGSGKSGNIEIFTPALKIEDGCKISTSTQGDGNAGQIDLDTGAIDLTNGSLITSDSGFQDASGNVIVGIGAAGKITVTAADSVSLSSGSLISSSTIGEGHGEEIIITAGGPVSLSSLSRITTSTAGEGYAGNITITAGGPVSISDSSNLEQVRTAIFTNTSGKGEAGKIFISSPDSSLIVNGGSIESATSGDGNGGEISLDVGSLELSDSAGISSNSGSLDSSTGKIVAGQGQAGKIKVAAADLVSLSSGSIISSSTVEGSGGTVSVITPATLKMDESSISAMTAGDGNAGKITLDVGTIELTNGAQLISESGFQDGLGNVIVGTGGAGTITVTAADSVSLSSLSRITSSTAGEGRAGNIIVTAGGPISISDSSKLEKVRTAIFTNTSGKGDAGKIFISSPDSSLIINEGSIESGTSGDGNGGEISLDVGSLELSDSAGISSNSVSLDSSTGKIVAGQGQAGEITVDAADLVSLSSGSVISSSTVEGSGGMVSVTTPAILKMDESFIGAVTAGDGNAGKITLDVGIIELTNGAQLTSQSGFQDGLSNVFVGTGDAGTITVTAADSVSLSSGSLISSSTVKGNGGIVSVTTPATLKMDGSAIAAMTSGDGNAGDITLDVGTIELTNGTQLTSESGFQDALGNIIVGTGQGGKITVTATDKASLSGYSQITTSTKGIGMGGELTIKAKEINLLDKSTISASSSSKNLNELINQDLNSEAGKSGNIFIIVDDTLQINNDSRITVHTEQANAGNITINAGCLVHLRESELNTSVAGGKGNGGNIFIYPVFAVLDGASKVIAQAEKGNGGNIIIGIVGNGAYFKSPDSIVDASSGFGDDGLVRIDAPDTDISGSISTLPASFLDASSLLSERCVTRTAGELSTFNIVGHGGMPLCPDTLWPAFYLLDNPKDQQKNPELNNR